MSTVEGEITPFAPFAPYIDAALQLRLDLPGDWRIEHLADAPTRLLAPPRGPDGFSVFMDIFAQPTPPEGRELFTFAAEQIFSVSGETSAADYKAQPTDSLKIDGRPAMLQRSSWTHGSGEQAVVVRQILLVVQDESRLYVFKAVMNVRLTPLAARTFSDIFGAIRFGPQPKAAPAPENKPTPPMAAPPHNQALAREGPPGRWRSRKHP